MESKAIIVTINNREWFPPPEWNCGTDVPLLTPPTIFVEGTPIPESPNSDTFRFPKILRWNWSTDIPLSSPTNPFVEEVSVSEPPSSFEFPTTNSVPVRIVKIIRNRVPESDTPSISQYSLRTNAPVSLSQIEKSPIPRDLI